MTPAQWREYDSLVYSKTELSKEQDLRLQFLRTLIEVEILRDELKNHREWLIRLSTKPHRVPLPSLVGPEYPGAYYIPERWWERLWRKIRDFVKPPKTQKIQARIGQIKALGLKK